MAATTNKKAATRLKIRDSLFMEVPASRSATAAGTRGFAGSVEGPRRRRDRVLANLAERFPDRSAVLARLQVRVEVLGAHRAHLEVHVRVVRTAELGAASDVGAGLVDAADLERVGAPRDHVALE